MTRSARSDGAIRRARPRDLEAVAGLWMDLSAHHAAFEPLFALRAGAGQAVHRLLAAQLRDANAALFVHDCGGGLDGFCSVRIDRAPPIHEEVVRAEITDVSVRPASRRRGIGRALVAAALAWVRERGVARVEVRVVAGNAEGQHFWRALGFDAFVDVLQRRL